MYKVNAAEASQEDISLQVSFSKDVITNNLKNNNIPISTIKTEENEITVGLTRKEDSD